MDEKQKAVRRRKVEELGRRIGEAVRANLDWTREDPEAVALAKELGVEVPGNEGGVRS